MFGVDEETAEADLARRNRRRRTVKRLAVTTLELIVVLPLFAVLGAIWLLLTPEGLSRVLEATADRRDSTLQVGDVAIHPASRWDEPSTWRILFEDVHITPDAAHRPRIHLDRVVLSMPDWQRLWERRELHVPEAWLIGLHIDAQQQRATPPRPRDPDALQLLAADTVHVWDAAYTAPADDPLPAAGVHGIYGTLSDVRFDPFSRKVDGVAHLSARRFHTGTLVLTDVVVDRITAEDSDLLLQDGRVAWEGHPARVAGRIDNIDERAIVELEVHLSDAPVEGLVQSATGEPSPLYGVADVDLVVHSGGELPRGGGYMDAHVELRRAILPLPPGTRGIYKDAIRLAPIVTLDVQDRVHFEHMVGDLTLSRGVVHLHELFYDARIPVVVRGEIDAERMDLWVRVVLGGDPDIHPGVGLRLQGPLTAPDVQRATRDELLPGWREKRAEARQERRAERGRFRLRAPKWLVRRDDDADQDGQSDETTEP